jgi:hypothetical protein
MRQWILASLVCMYAFDAAAQASKLEPEVLQLRVGEKRILKVTPDASLTFSAVDPQIVTVDAGRLTITGLKPGAVSLVGRNAANETSNLVKVTVVPADVKIAELEKPLLQGETRAITLPAAIGEVNGPFKLQPAKGNETFVTVSSDSKSVTGLAVTGDQPVTLNVVMANDVVAGTATAVVLEAIDRIEANLPFELTEGTSKDLGVKLIGKQKTSFTPAQRPLKPTVTPPNTIAVDQNGVVQASFLTDAKEKTIPIVLTYEQGLNNAAVTLPFTVTVRVSAGSIVPPAGTSLPRDGRVVITPTMRDRAGNELTVKHIDWSLKVPANDKYVTLAPTDKSLVLMWKDAGAEERSRPRFVEINLLARSDHDVVISDTLVVQLLREVAGFAPLKVRLNIMDDQTATDLYGKVTANEYFVTRVRLNNNLSASSDPALQGGSILAFSESIEVAVQYEKRELGKKKEGGMKSKAEWEPVTDVDLQYFEDGANDFASPDLHVDPRCKGFITYRPYMFEMMVNSVDRRDERSARSKTLRILQTVGTLASIVTSVAVPGPQSDFPLAIEKYNSLLLPGFEKLWPTLRETNRQNVVSQTMKNIEEIPFGSDLARVLFFPKREFRGLLARYETRVARICPYHFNVEVAVIQKKQTVPAGQ